MTKFPLYARAWLCRNDVLDQHLTVILAMTNRAPILLLPLIFQYPHLGGAVIDENLCCNFGVLNQWGTQSELFLAYRKHMIELTLCPWFACHSLHANHIAR